MKRGGLQLNVDIQSKQASDVMADACSAAGLHDEPVPDAAHILNILGGGRIILDLLSESVDIYHDSVFIYDGLSPDY